MRRLIGSGSTRLAVTAVLVFLAAATAGYLTSHDPKNSPGTPAPSTTTNLVQGSVLARNSDSLRIQTPDGTREVRLFPSTRVERLAPVGLDTIRAGDWANVGAVRNRQSLFAITAIVLISPDVLGGQR